ncbi:SH2 domain-containing adapter protein D isoform X2 [Tachyglossus aculeatus]|uniref:SH2 domain-containing adapter protein D isoform X2 n=1 Tax=Tachyglossus aculeatus TaxID=9261 RepID=UPI0018F593FF|nr:SH2 domain-containing adapter protein D isoform X2 [Tachyglossus aculeatus]
MAKWLKDYLNFGSRRSPPQPPKPDYTESDIFRAYRVQKSLDFEDPYEDGEGKAESDPGTLDSPGKYSTLKHRLIKVDSTDLNCDKVLLGTPGKDKPAAESEYCDPFDTRDEARVALGKQPLPENNGYMEPYAAQRVMAELLQPEGQRGPGTQAGLQLYDTPYEEQREGLEAEGRTRPLENRLPQDDERPADEYDQPWEWKKDHISRAFAVQFESPECEPASGLAKEHWCPPPTLGLGGSKLWRGPIREGSTPVAERVDPTVPLEKQAWFHGSISRVEAESQLSLCKEGSYMVRHSETSRDDYSLSLRSSQGFLHMKFTRTKEDKYVLGQHSGPFASIPEAVHYYCARPLPVQGAEHLALLYPITVQTL